ncbi:MAG: hypothetical protein BGO29_04565 [Bacteroidales bacterium 36-12]|nr:MAG: hypothetical protein BGO29_04565 [Bacteroidales bacterium 36-12]
MAKVGKIDFKKVAMNAIITAGTGAVAQVLKEAVLVNDPETMDYVMIGGGVLLPELVKSPYVASAGNALLAIGVYRMSDRLGLASKIGINDGVTPAAAGLPGQYSVGSGWKPVFQNPGKRKQNANPGAVVQ